MKTLVALSLALSLSTGAAGPLPRPIHAEPWFWTVWTVATLQTLATMLLTNLAWSYVVLRPHDHHGEP